jgi:hypothetical protein
MLRCRTSAAPLEDKFNVMFTVWQEGLHVSCHSPEDPSLKVSVLTHFTDEDSGIYTSENVVLKSHSVKQWSGPLWLPA